ncbi:MAG TPA: hypothetical protein DHD79_00030 [Firmicutes bacterium]|jgi:tetratricopeptide (TPR) repeat protein|nr:hypothetical protein [Bacillota bacterium]HBE07011.1 hypothetical protein [Bacillota bacterium]HBG43999.1 hypothetical protein [Bacillota bacterium]HBL67627.1 hypothetical protein [Bacillota bacterium]HBR24143.1 hypothetical protein [Bacillota bacterium]
MEKKMKKLIIAGVFVWMVLLAFGFIRYAQWRSKEAFQKGIHLAESGELDEAHVLFSQAKKWQPRDWEIRDQLGMILMRKGLYEEARAEFAYVLQIKPDYAEAHKYIGFCYVHEQNWEQAIGAFQKACEVNPSDLMSHELVAVTAEKVGKTGLALDHWDNILALDPDNEKALERSALLRDPDHDSHAHELHE